MGELELYHRVRQRNMQVLELGKNHAPGQAGHTSIFSKTRHGPEQPAPAIPVLSGEFGLDGLQRPLPTSASQ